MAYEPKEWVCSETITADALNNIEAGVQEALAKECDCGYSCGSTYLEVFAETVEAVQEGSVFVAYGTADSELTDESIRVTIDGDSYILPRVDRENRNTRAPQLSYYYGEWDFSQFLPVFTTYPITIEGTEGSDNIIIYTQTEGEHQVEIAVLRNGVTTTECFKRAVQSLSGYSCREAEVELFNDTVTTTDSVITGIYTGVISPTKITADRIRVVYDGTPYTLDKDENGNYGTTDYDMTNFTIDFEDCPFLIYWFGNYNVEAIATETAGDHTLEIYAIETVATLTECFRIAVQSLTKPLIFSVLEATEVTDPCEGTRYTYSHSWQEVHDAFIAGRPCIVHHVEPSLVDDQIVIRVFDAGAELEVATRYRQFNFADKNSRTYVDCGAQ